MKATVKRQELFLTGNTCPPVANIIDVTQNISILLTETIIEQVTRIEFSSTIHTDNLFELSLEKFCCKPGCIFPNSSWSQFGN